MSNSSHNFGTKHVKHYDHHMLHSIILGIWSLGRPTLIPNKYTFLLIKAFKITKHII